MPELQLRDMTAQEAAKLPELLSGLNKRETALPSGKIPP
jgi:hypothetical protein